jgi:hypothetical protein
MCRCMCEVKSDIVALLSDVYFHVAGTFIGRIALNAAALYHIAQWETIIPYVTLILD